MPVESHQIEIRAKGFCDVHDLSTDLAAVMQASELAEGIACIFVPGSTGGLTTIGIESGAVRDFQHLIEELVPREKHYEHNAAYGDGNGFSHMRASLLGPSVSVPFRDGRLQLGTWQQVIFVDFDNRPRNRRLIVQLVGE